VLSYKQAYFCANGELPPSEGSGLKQQWLRVQFVYLRTIKLLSFIDSMATQALEWFDHSEGEPSARPLLGSPSFFMRIQIQSP
jgi:hypothetical protein